MKYARKAPTSLRKIIGNYKVPILPLNENPVVIDCGVGEGYFFWLYNSFFSKYIAIEASIENINLLKEKIKKINYTNYKIFHNACYSRDDVELKLKTILNKDILEKGFTANNNSLFYEIGQKDKNWKNSISEKDLYSQKVKSISLDNVFKLLKLEKIDFLKVDIEGAEYDFLINKNLHNVRFLSVEAPQKFKKNKELLKYIKQEGFIEIFNNGKDITFANEREKIDQIYFVDFPTLYFSKLKNDIYISHDQISSYIKNQTNNKFTTKIYNRLNRLISKIKI
jgi:FkbM family methyltransferase